jgi:hypothetical protein
MLHNACCVFLGVMRTQRDPKLKALPAMSDPKNSAVLQFDERILFSAGSLPSSSAFLGYDNARHDVTTPPPPASTPPPSPSPPQVADMHRTRRTSSTTNANSMTAIPAAPTKSVGFASSSSSSSAVPISSATFDAYRNRSQRTSVDVTAVSAPPAVETTHVDNATTSTFIDRGAATTAPSTTATAPALSTTGARGAHSSPSSALATGNTMSMLPQPLPEDAPLASVRSALNRIASLAATMQGENQRAMHDLAAIRQKETRRSQFLLEEVFPACERVANADKAFAQQLLQQSSSSAVSQPAHEVSGMEQLRRRLDGADGEGAAPHPRSASAFSSAGALPPAHGGALSSSSPSSSSLAATVQQLRAYQHSEDDRAVMRMSLR